MKLFKYLLPVAAAVCSLAAPVTASEYSSRSEMNERDFEAVYDFIKCKRQMCLSEKACDLRVSGDVRMEWANIKEKHDGARHRGKIAQRSPLWFNGERIPDNEFDVEFNLMLDYSNDCTWAVAHVEFDNNAGIDISNRGCCGRMREGCDANDNYTNTNVVGDPNGCHGSGMCSNVCLRKAYFGWNIYEECNSRLDVEVGRRYFYDAFESRIMYRSRFDGALFRYSNCFECVGDFYVNLGFFVIDENSSHWGYVLETGLIDIADYGIDFKYSFIDWTKNGQNRCSVSDPWGMAFQVSHFYLAYNFNPELLCTKARIYAALAINHDAPRRSEFNNNKEDLAWYIGFMVGEVCHEGDWHFDINYQHVEAQAIPDCDVSGIGRGNVRDIPITVSTAGGNTNYQGWRLEGLYALTDNLALNPSWEYSEEENAGYGGPMTYSKFEIQAIYAF